MPIKSLMKRLHIQEYDLPTPISEKTVAAGKLVLPLKQSAGAANRPLVRPGERVAAGQALGTVPEGSLGAVLHAPCAGTITAVTGERIVLARTS